MDTIKSFKGYGKVNPAEDREFRRKSRNRLIVIGVAAIVLVAIVIGVAIAAVRSKSTGDGDSYQTSSTSLSDSIKVVCSVTRYPISCFSSISSANGISTVRNDPKQLFEISLRVAMDEISKVSSSIANFTIPLNDKRLVLAIRDCKELFADAIDRLNDSISSIRSASEGKSLTASSINDLRTWISAAITDQDTCLDGFEGTTESIREKLEAAMVNSTQFTSNSLAIATKVLGAFEKFTSRFHRKLLATTGNHRFPRALLQDLSRLKPNVTVAQDGTGQVKTISEAIAMIPKKSKDPFVIYVKEGVYRENVFIDKNRWNVIAVGDGMYKTIVDGKLNFVDGTPTFSTATFAVAGKRFMARDMGFKNSAGPEKHQAVALRSSSDCSVFYRCSFDAFQDTLYAHSFRQFYRECDITGTIDFIFGDSSVVFQNCNIRPRQALPNQQNTITAQGKKDPNENTGISIQGCSITPYDNVTVPTYLGRPWKDYSTTIIMQSEIGSVIHPAGWLSWVAGTLPPDTIYYSEYQNTGPGSSVAERVKWPGYTPAITAEEAKKYTVELFLKGSDWIAETGVVFQSTLG
ncbi:pectinesterase 3-like [Typha latifolia]|uniref:pectinesterase 3-like n=1 Tax=Typha latifolia TaxID=4733 RepID=UPI003C2C42F9